MTIMVHGHMLSKVEFFDYVYDTFVEADYTEPDSALSCNLRVLYGILDMLGWTAEYRQWVADGAGADEAAERLHLLLA